MIVAHPILCMTGVERVYGSVENPLRVLHDINLTVQPGEYVAIVGPSGSGKSTLLNILGCLDRQSKGTYFLTGEDVSQFNDNQRSMVRRTRIGFVFQSYQLISHLSVLENVEMPLFYARVPRKQRHERCRELIERVGLSHRATHLPSELSGGENQRAAIARALTNEPALILADEPTGNLDSATSAEIMALFEELHEAGRTIVLITHDHDIARTVPRQVSLRDGQIENDTQSGVAT